MTEEVAWSSGGRGGAVVVLEDLDLAASALLSAAGDLDDAARTLGVAAHLCTWRSEGAALVGAAAGAARSASVVAAGLRALAADLTAAAGAYLDAEHAARAALTLPRALAETAADWAGSVAWIHRWGTTLALAASPVVGAVRVVTGGDAPAAVAPDGPPPTTGALNRDTASALLATTGDGYDRLARTLARAVAQAEALEPAHAGVAADPRGAPDFEPPRSVETVMRRLDWLEARGGGTVAIETVTDPTGRTRHLVYVPGTQDWGVVDPNPADLQANLATISGGASDAARAVTAAMAAHGIGPDEPVLLAGHSQGGMVATALAGALVGRYRVTHVVTAGSPTGRLALPPRAEALHLENTRDLVPGLDARANPDRANRVTVSHDRRRSADPGRPDGSRTVAQAHAIDGYASTARLVDRGMSASTEAWLDGARPFLESDRGRLAAYRPVAG